MAFFSPENSIDQAQPQRARQGSDKDEADRKKSVTFHASVSFGNKPKPSAEADEVAKQHGFYTAEKRSTRIYYSDYQQKTEVMRADASKISTRLDDRQTVGAMLDLAQSRGWDTVKLRGTEDFKREAWVQSQVRGIETEGYRPKATDTQEAERRKAAAAPVNAPAKQVPAAKQQVSSAPAPSKRDAQPRQAPTAADKPAAPAVKPAAQTVWGEVEKQGQRARAAGSMPPAERQTSASRPKASEAA